VLDLVNTMVKLQSGRYEVLRVVFVKIQVFFGGVLSFLLVNNKPVFWKSTIPHLQG